VALGRDSGQAKVLAFTAAAVREKIPDAEFTAITEVPPLRGNSRHEFTVSLLEASHIQVVPLAGLDQYARALGSRLN
jgi:aspartate/methionine/tyrosine aminotransferase